MRYSKLLAITCLIALGSIPSAFADSAQQPLSLAPNFIGANNSLFANAAKAGINPTVLNYALNGYDWAKLQGKVQNPYILTIVDFSIPNDQPRLWVINLKNNTILMKLYVANGANSGRYVSNKFSNKVNTHESSLGVYTTAMSAFQGVHGRALKVHGLESGINDNAFKRHIEIHGTPYVSKYFAKYDHRVGGSWGCFAVSQHKIQSLINDIVGGSVLYAYAPQESSDGTVSPNS